MGAIFKREFKSYFVTPIGYIFAAVYLIISGAIFWLCVLSSGTGSYSSFFLMELFAFIILIPILTMKLLSEEQKMKTDISLLTSPVSLTKIILGKFLAAFALFVIVFLVSCTPCLLMYKYGTMPNTAAIITNMLGIIFVGAAFISVGMFISSLTENQFVAAIVSILVILFFLVMNFIASFISVYAIRYVVDWFSFYTRYYTFTEGILSIESIVYFISFTVIFIFLTVRVYETRRWK